jgi:hypothetical protein
MQRVCFDSSIHLFCPAPLGSFPTCLFRLGLPLTLCICGCLKYAHALQVRFRGPGDRRCMETVQLLLDWGANTTIKSEFDTTAITVAGAIRLPCPVISSPILAISITTVQSTHTLVLPSCWHSYVFVFLVHLLHAYAQSTAMLP